MRVVRKGKWAEQGLGRVLPAPEGMIAKGRSPGGLSTSEPAVALCAGPQGGLGRATCPGWEGGVAGPCDGLPHALAAAAAKAF